MSTSPVDWRIWKRPEIATRFASQMRQRLPGADLQFDVLYRLVSRVVANPLHVLDIGCGDGIILDSILQKRPGTIGVALDGSPTMLAGAAERFAHHSSRPTLVEADFNAPDWTARLPLRKFHVVVSGFAIHHSPDDVKRRIYAQIFDLLNAGGLFVNIEHVASATALGEELWSRVIAELTTAAHRALGNPVDVETVLAEYLTSDERAANLLAPLPTQLDWLKEIGFVDVDCYWKYFELAMLAGYRPK
jgi:SAM-dependent methyltransferase